MPAMDARTRADAPTEPRVTVFVVGSVDDAQLAALGAVVRRRTGAVATVDGSAGSCPASTVKASAMSTTFRAIGPGWSRDQLSGKMPALLIRP